MEKTPALEYEVIVCSEIADKGIDALHEAFADNSSNTELNERLKEIYESLTEEQKDRHESHKDANFNDLHKRQIAHYLESFSSNVKFNKMSTVCISAFVKLYLSDIIIKAREVAKLEGHTSPIEPHHVNRAYQNLKIQKRVPRRRFSRQLALSLQHFN